MFECVQHASLRLSFRQLSLHASDEAQDMPPEMSTFPFDVFEVEARALFALEAPKCHPTWAH